MDRIHKKINAIIIEKYEAARKAVEFFVDMIEEFREGVADMIKDGELERAQKAIELAQEFNHKTTMDDIKKILTGA